MAYQISLSNGSLLTNLADNTTDTTTSLTLVGRNYPGYGQFIANNFVRLLENAANSAPPGRPLVGQLWYDTSTQLMKVWTGSINGWFSLTTGVSSVIGLSNAITLQQLIAGGLAPLASPALTGVPTAPTPPTGTNSNQIATVAYVLNQIGTVVGGVSSVIGATGAVTLAQLIAGGLAPLGSPSLTGTPTAPNPPIGSNNNQIATTSYVISQVGALSTGVTSVLGASGAVSLNQLTAGGLAPSANPQFTGAPSGPTAATGSNTSQLATTAFVAAALATVVPNVRKIVTGPLSMYVSPAGSDSTNIGTQASPFQTMQHAYNVVAAGYDGANNPFTIVLLAGTHSSGLAMSGRLVGFTVVNVQSLGSPGSFNSSGTIVSIASGNAFSVILSANLVISGITIAATGNNTNTNQTGNCISCANGGFVTIGTSVVFDVAGGYHILVQAGGAVGCTSNYIITGGATSGHIAAAESSTFTYNGLINNATVTLSGTPAFGVFAVGASGATLQFFGVTFSGTATGSKFSLSTNATLGVNGAGINYLPGSTAGVISTGGIYG